MPEWRLLMLGGTTASGKSTIAPKVAQALGFACLSADSVWRAILTMTTAETHPLLHRWPRPEVIPDDPQELLQVHIGEAEAMTPALEAFINWELKEANRFVFQGAWITPELAARLRAASDDTRAVFIDEPDADQITASILERSRRTEPDARQVIVAKVAWLYGNWLREETKRHRVPIVLRNPRETLVARIIEAAR